MKTHFDQAWKNWIRANVDAGRDRDGIFKILLDEGCEYLAIKNENTIQQAMPVKSGYKAIITKWFHAKSNKVMAPSSMYTEEANEYIQNFTETGIAKRLYREHKFGNITEFYQFNKSRDRNEQVPGDFVYNEKSGSQNSALIDLSPELKREIHEHFDVCY